ncbi:s-protein like protein 2 [Quercus suber]|uniref:S-protein homolog n=1 Tax=Quercus suber TaxID=58331 RepID=A0AAW0LHE2_QUESU
MDQMITTQLYCFVFIHLLAFGQSTSLKLTSDIVTSVRIVNHLNKKPLTYHCKSANDDLGLRTLQPNRQWEFHFHPATFETTDFYCYFFHGKLRAAFDVYVEDSRLEANCDGDHCIWTAREDGFYLYNMGTRQNVKMHNWNT